MILIISILFSLLIFISSDPVCTENSRNCEKCNPITNLCYRCTKNSFIPDDTGGCIKKKQCNMGKNFCDQCNEKGDLCLICEIGFYPDEVGGCSYTENCNISDKGECLECKEDFFLIGQSNNFKICKYRYTNDLKNCDIVDNTTGLCNKCNEGFNITSNDKTCIENCEFCLESTFGVCSECEEGYFLDKTDDKCKKSNGNLRNCKLSLDGKKCEECLTKYYFSDDGICISVKNCEKYIESNNFSCKKCKEGYYLSKSGNACTLEKNCQSGDKELSLCDSCISGYYINLKNRECISNEENNDYYKCTRVDKNGVCLGCEIYYLLGLDNKCSTSRHCAEAENGICVKCLNKFFLGLDNTCSEVEHCIYTNLIGNCIECEDGYFFNFTVNKCQEQYENFTGCKMVYYPSDRCHSCKNGYYLSQNDYKCYEYNENDHLYKCAKVDLNNETECVECHENYFLGSIDNKCSQIEGCALSKNETNCIECDEEFCFDVSKQICVSNFVFPEKEEDIKYFSCKRTNEKGECEECYDEKGEIKNGVCYNIGDCESKDENGDCVKCTNNSPFIMCVNKILGCVNTFAYGCLRCDDPFNTDKCTECLEGFELDEDSKCVEIYDD